MTEEDKYEDPKERRNLRFEYRKLISDTERKKFVIVNFVVLNMDSSFPRVINMEQLVLYALIILILVLIINVTAAESCFFIAKFAFKKSVS